MKEIIKIWIEIAKSDLNSSKILYENGKFRNSYFLFQQASEKIIKAFALLNKTLTEDELSKIQHDQTKIYRKSIIQQQKSIAETNELINKIKTPVYSGLFLDKIITKHSENLKESISSIDSLRNCDLVNISVEELNEFLDIIKGLRDFKITLPENINDILKSKITETVNWISQFNTQSTNEIEKEYKALIENDYEREKLFNFLIEKIMPLMFEVSYVSYTLLICAILTIQHSSLTRYPSDGITPQNIYIKELPIIDKQMEFITLLEDCITRIEKYNK